jgi:hypothetical protein
MKFIMLSVLFFIGACASQPSQNSRTIASIQNPEETNARTLSSIHDPELSDQVLIHVD